MTKCVNHSQSAKHKRQQGKQCITRWELREVSAGLKRLQEQQGVMQRTVSGELRRLQKQQLNMRQKSQILSTELKRLEQEVQQGRRESGETHQQDVPLGKQVGEVLRDGMSQFIRGMLR